MRKMYLLIGSLALGIGLLLGAVGYALATTSVDGDSRLAFWDNNDSKSTAGPITGSLNGPTLGTTGPNDLSHFDELSGISSSPEEEDLNLDETMTSGNPKTVPEELAQVIISDYKLNIATLFEAWKTIDMVSFRAELSKAYTGDLFEKHARQAEPFIAQGVGIDVSDIRFNSVKVDAATATSATLTASYNYLAKDYDLGNEVAMGENVEHEVKVRVNMVKNDERWLITGETTLQ